MLVYAHCAQAARCWYNTMKHAFQSAFVKSGFTTLAHDRYIVLEIWLIKNGIAHCEQDERDFSYEASLRASPRSAGLECRQVDLGGCTWTRMRAKG